MSYIELSAYLAKLKKKSAASGVRIDWSAVDSEKVEIYGHKQRMGLQIADAVASAMWNGVNPNAYGHTEPRYAEILLPTVYAHKKQRFGYGVKVLPSEIMRSAAPPPGTEWLQGEAWR